MSLYTSAPGKYLWGTGAALLTVVKVPALALYHSPSFMRPVPEWTLFQAFMNNLMNSFLYHSAVVESKTPLSLDPGSLGDRFQVAQPGPASLYKGVLSTDAEIKPVAVGGTWYPAKYSPSASSEPVVLHFHGGGYAIATGRPDDAAFAGQQLNRVGSHAFLVQYRLASNPGGRFPAALQDAITAYNHLLTDLQIPSNRIVISGDSVGGHIVVCMLRYLADHGAAANLPNPCAALIFSGAVNLLAGTQYANIASNPNYGIDYTDATFMMWGARKFVSTKPEAAAYMNPLGAAFATSVPIWSHVGGKEFFHAEATQFIREMQAVPGNSAQIMVEKNAVHDIFFTGNLMGWQKEAEDAADRAGAWVKALGS